LAYFSGNEALEHFESLYRSGSIRYGDLKKQLAEDIIRFTSPFREKMAALDSDHEYLKKVTNLGAEKARESAGKTIREIRDIIGFKPF
jgi:tryptophanyl-tRNA synthetase